MAVAAVLRSQDCLLKSQNHHPPKSNPRPRRRKRSPNGRGEIKNGNPTAPTSHKLSSLSKSNSSSDNIVMGQVRILKRGEPLPEPDGKDGVVTNLSKPKNAAVKKKVVGSPDVCVNDVELDLESPAVRVCPEQDISAEEIRASDFYTGSSLLVVSPPPSSLPLPAVLTKKEKKSDDSRTCDLLKLLRLDLL